jgi:hypothetical protein
VPAGALRQPIRSHVALQWVKGPDQGVSFFGDAQHGQEALKIPAVVA